MRIVFGREVGFSANLRLRCSGIGLATKRRICLMGGIALEFTSEVL